MADCPECQKWREKGAKFCGACGQHFAEEPPEKKPTGMNDIAWNLVLIGILAGVLIIMCNTVYMIANFSYFMDYTKNITVSFGIYLGITYFPLFRYGSTGMCVELIMCLVLQVTFLAYALYRLRQIHARDPVDYEAHISSGMGAAIWVLAIDYLLSLVGLLITYSLTQQVPDSSWLADYDEVFLQYELTGAGVVEELIYRVLFIGVPIAVVGFIAHRDRKSWQYIMGGFGMNKAALVLLVFSSLMFGLAHYSGWGWSKIPLAFISGLLYGYLYCEYGLYACVLTHTITDTILIVPLLGPLMGLGFMALGVVALVWLILNPRKELQNVKGMSKVPPRIEKNFLQNWGRH